MEATLVPIPNKLFVIAYKALDHKAYPQYCTLEQILSELGDSIKVRTDNAEDKQAIKSFFVNALKEAAIKNSYDSVKLRQRVIDSVTDTLYIPPISHSTLARWFKESSDYQHTYNSISSRRKRKNSSKDKSLKTSFEPIKRKPLCATSPDFSSFEPNLQKHINMIKKE